MLYDNNYNSKKKFLIKKCLYFLLFIFACSCHLNCTGEKQKDVLNQEFANKVINAFYTQGKEYENNIRPILSEPPTNENMQKVMNLYSNSLEDMLLNLQDIEIYKIDSDLINIYREAALTTEEMIKIFNKQDNTKYFDDIILLADKLSLQQAEFEEKCKLLGLDLYATGID